MKKLYIFLVSVLWSMISPVGAQADNSREPVKDGKFTFYLIFKSHFDIGYSALARDVIHEYRTTMIDRALDVMDRHRDNNEGQQFVWTVPGWPLSQMLWDKQDPSRRLRIEEAIRKGDLVTHALPYTVHTGALELEELVRGLGYSSRLAREYGLPLPTDAKMTDVPGHSWIWPTLMKHAGITFFHMGANPTNQTVEVPPLFWWEGPDGSRVLTMFSQGYGSGTFPPEDWPHRSWLTFVHAGDNDGPPTVEDVEKIIRRIRGRYPNATVKIGKMADFADAIFEENPELPVVRGDMSDGWIFGVMSNPHATQAARRIRPLITAFETLATQEKEWGLYTPDTSGELADMYENSLMYGEHTWGLANQHFVTGKIGKDWDEMYGMGLDPAYTHMANSWDEHGAYIEKAAGALRPELENSLLTLAENVAQDGIRIVVYNPLPWARGGMVNFVFPFMGTAAGPWVREVGTDNVQPVQLYGYLSRRVGYFYAADIPANGYKTFVFTKEAPAVASASGLQGDDKKGYIENRWYKITFDRQKGCIKSIFDKINNRELVDTGAKDGFGSYVYERYDKASSMRFLKEYIFDSYAKTHYEIMAKSTSYLTDDLKSEHYSPGNMNFRVELQGSCIKGILTPSLSKDEGMHTAGMTVTLHEDMPYIDLRVAVINHPATEVPEAGWIALPFKTQAPQYRISRVGSVVDPAGDFITGSQYNYIWSNGGVMIKDGDWSVGVCPVDAPAFVLGKLDFMHFQGTWENPDSHIYLNLFNNRWNTNFKSFWNGNLTSEVRLWVNGADADDESGLIVPAWETRLPLQVGMANSPGGQLPAARRGLTLSRKGVLVTAYGANPDGDGTVLRLWENAGKEGVCEITLPVEFSGLAQPVNLRGMPAGEPIAIENGVFKTDLGKFSPVSFIIYK